MPLKRNGCSNLMSSNVTDNLKCECPIEREEELSNINKEKGIVDVEISLR